MCSRWSTTLIERRRSHVDERRQDVHADDAAGRGDRAQVLVAEVAVVVAQRARARMRRDDDARRELEHVVDRRRGEMRDVEQDAEPLELSDRAHAAGRQAAARLLVRASPPRAAHATSA